MPRLFFLRKFQAVKRRRHNRLRSAQASATRDGRWSHSLAKARPGGGRQLLAGIVTGLVNSVLGEPAPSRTVVSNRQRSVAKGISTWPGRRRKSLRRVARVNAGGSQSRYCDDRRGTVPSRTVRSRLREANRGVDYVSSFGRQGPTSLPRVDSLRSRH